MKTHVDCFTGSLPAAPVCRTADWPVHGSFGEICYAEATSLAVMTV